MFPERISPLSLGLIAKIEAIATDFQGEKVIRHPSSKTLACIPLSSRIFQATSLLEMQYLNILIWSKGFTMFQPRQNGSQRMHPTTLNQSTSLTTATVIRQGA
jgi:hypothetical protein